MLGVHIQVNTAVSPEELKQSPADEIILATGSKPKMLSVPGAELLAAEEVLTGKREAGASTVVIGGGLVGCETALWLKKEKGTEVTIVELQPDILSVGGPLCSANSDMLRDLLVYHGVEVLTGSCVTGKSAEGCAVRTPQGDKVVAADTVICAVGYASEKNLYEQVREEMPYVHLLGDAEHVSNIMYAVWNAYELARNL